MYSYICTRTSMMFCDRIYKNVLIKCLALITNYFAGSEMSLQYNKTNISKLVIPMNV